MGVDGLDVDDVEKILAEANAALVEANKGGDDRDLKGAGEALETDVDLIMAEVEAALMEANNALLGEGGERQKEYDIKKEKESVSKNDDPETLEAGLTHAATIFFAEEKAFVAEAITENKRFVEADDATSVKSMGTSKEITESVSEELLKDDNRNHNENSSIKLEAKIREVKLAEEAVMMLNQQFQATTNGVLEEKKQKKRNSRKNRRRNRRKKIVTSFKKTIQKVSHIDDNDVMIIDTRDAPNIVMNTGEEASSWADFLRED
mmetsp:Transcript_63591/g.94380  ORF Transcript_63591/g.94380 Transcript_63591/m.94380 type:complete len:263 (+) Transcript_63591:997-1785(+)